MDKYPGLTTLITAPASTPSAAAGGGGGGAGGGGGGGSAAAAATAGATADGGENGASTASTVAIDNKIEQAMDLVKSHLMFAVREEVEVLKEKITELLDRISQLEYENMVLRQYATQEALQKIQQHHASNT